MIKEAENFLNCRQHLRDNIPMLIELFVRYYGEEKRKEIEEKLSNTLYLAYRKPSTTSSYLDDISNDISIEIIHRYMEELNISLPEEGLFGYDFKHENIQPITNYQAFYELYILGPEGREQRFKEESLKSMNKYLPELTMEEYEQMIRTKEIPHKYDHVRLWIRNNILYYIDLENVEKRYRKAFKNSEDLLHMIDPDITLDNYSYYADNDQIQQLNRLAEKKPAMVQEYNDRMSEYSVYQKEAEEDTRLIHNLRQEFYIKLIEENLDLLSQNDIEAFEEYKKNPDSSYLLSSYIQFLFSYSIEANHPLDNFSEDAERIVREKDTMNWQKESIIKKRIEYFQQNGIDLGDDYEAYVESEEAKKIWPSVERVAKFIETRDRLLNEFNIAYYTSSPAHVEARKEIDALHFLDKDDSFNAALYTSKNSKTFVNPNVIQRDDGYHIYPLVAINCDLRTGQIDHDIIHELNHIYELTLQSVEGNQYNAICGWDTMRGSINQEEQTPVNTLEEDDSKRPYELFNEIINEIIAQQITELMMEKDQHIFDTKYNAQYKNTSSYERSFFLVKDFFQEFKKEIIESRSNGNIQIIWDKVGKENFDELNELFHIFFNHFAGYQYYHLLQSLKNNEENENTKIYHDLVEKRDAILEKMRKHSMMHEQQEKKEETKEVKS